MVEYSKYVFSNYYYIISFNITQGKNIFNKETAIRQKKLKEIEIKFKEI